MKGSKMAFEDLFRTKPKIEPINMADPVVSKKPTKGPYQVGVNIDGMTTLTLVPENGLETTLVMNQAGWEQLIRMVRATYIDLNSENSLNQPTDEI